MVKTLLENGNKILLRELTSEFKISLKDIHDAIGLDYNKPFSIYRFVGKFTENQLIKLFLETSELTSFIFMKNTCASVQFAEITSNGLNLNKLNNQVSFLHPFHTKTDFNANRIKNQVAYLIVVSKKDLGITSNLKNPYSDSNNFKEKFWNDKTLRHKVRQTIQSNYNGISGISGVDIFTNRDNWVYIRFNQVKSIYDVIDKSGYNVLIKRNELEQKTRQLKADRDKIKASQYNYHTEFAELETDCYNTINQIVSELNVNNIDKYTKLVNILQSFNWYLIDLKTMNNKIKSNKYNRVETFKNELNYIQKALNTLKDKSSEII